MSKSITFTYHEELELEVEADVTPGSPGSYYDPPEPPEVDLTVYLVRKDKDGKKEFLDITKFLTDDQISRIGDAALEEAEQAARDAYESAMEARADARADR